MSRIMNSMRTLIFVLSVGILAACTQSSSGVSTFSGDLTVKQKQAKIIAARKRAAAQKAQRKKAFLEKRRKARAKRLASRKKSGLAKPKTKTASKKKLKKSRKKLARKKSRKLRGKVRRAKTRSIKGTSYAYVGGRSRGIHKRAPWRCVPKRLKIVLKQVSKKFGRVTINSTHRSRGKNRRVGGKRRSYHLRCQAVDFRVHGRTRGLTRWLARHPYVGGYNRYPSGYYHIDTGPKRTW